MLPGEAWTNSWSFGKGSLSEALPPPHLLAGEHLEEYYQENDSEEEDEA